MNIAFNSFLTMPLQLSSLKEKIKLTPQQKAIAQIALMVFSLIAAFGLLIFQSYWSQRVKVVEPDGTTYISQRAQVNGRVTMIADNYFCIKSIFEGEFTKGKLNGLGKIIHPKGSVAQVEGEFKNNWLQGPGKITYRDGKIVEGDIKSGPGFLGIYESTLNGQGTIHYPDGKTEEGKFEYDQLHGRGTRIYLNGNREEGVFQNGQLIPS